MNQTIAITPKTKGILERVRRVENIGYERILETALRDYLEKKTRWQQIRRWGRASARKAGISRMTQVEALVDETRR